MKKKILVIRFQHETNAFSPVPANMQSYENRGYTVGEASFEEHRGRGTDLGGVLAALEDARYDFELVPTVSMFAMPSGPVTRDVFEFVLEKIKRALEERGPVDGVMIAFHGAMVAEGHPDAEGDMLEILRELVGWEIPIMCSLDLHANVTEKMARCANVLVPYECYPHIDVYDTSVVTAQMLARTLVGEIRPVMAYRRIPHLLPLFPTTRPEFRPLYDLAQKCQQRPGALCVRFSHGFFAADIEEMGMAVMAITDNDRELAESIAGEMEQAILREKDGLREDYPTLDEALDRIGQGGDGPVVIADTSDNTGGGGMGNTTHILRRVLERGLTGGAFAVFVDPDSVDKCIRAGVGATVELELGGTGDPALSGGPVKVSAYVRMITDGMYRFKGQMSNGNLIRGGRTVVLEIGGNDVIVNTFPHQPLDLEVFRSHGITPEEKRFLVVKSAIHYRASYGTIAREMMAVPLPGYIPPVPDGMPFRNWKGKV